MTMTSTGYREPSLREWHRVRELEAELQGLHRRFNRVRTPSRQYWDRKAPGGGVGVIYEDEAVLLGDIMSKASKVLDELERIEGRPTQQARQVFEEAMKRINAQRSEERRARARPRW